MLPLANYHVEPVDPGDEQTRAIRKTGIMIIEPGSLVLLALQVAKRHYCCMFGVDQRAIGRLSPRPHDGKQRKSPANLLKVRHLSELLCKRLRFV